MTWEDKVELCTYLNNGEYYEAVKLMISNLDDDAQALDMFITGWDLTQSVELLLPLKSYLFKHLSDVKGVVTSVRLRVMVTLIDEWESYG